MIERNRIRKEYTVCCVCTKCGRKPKKHSIQFTLDSLCSPVTQQPWNNPEVFLFYSCPFQLRRCFDVFYTTHTHHTIYHQFNFPPPKTIKSQRLGSNSHCFFFVWSRLIACSSFVCGFFWSRALELNSFQYISWNRLVIGVDRKTRKSG